MSTVGSNIIDNLTSHDRVCDQCCSPVVGQATNCPECGVSLLGVRPIVPGMPIPWDLMQAAIVTLSSAAARWFLAPMLTLGLLRYTVKGLFGVWAAILIVETVRCLWVLAMMENRPGALDSSRRVAWEIGLPTLTLLMVEWFASVGICRTVSFGWSETTWLLHVTPLGIHLPVALLLMLGFTRARRRRLADPDRPVLLIALGMVLLAAILHAALAWMLLPQHIVSSLTDRYERTASGFSVH
jgi:hypothetical protein